MPSFLSNFRSKSRASIKPEKSAANLKDQANRNSSSNGNNANANANGNGLGAVRRNKSSSTLNSSARGSSNPSEDLSQSSNPFKNGTPPPLPTSRPQRPSVNTTNRYSMNGINGMTSAGTNSSHRSLNPSSLLAPRVLSITEDSWVNQKILLIFGQIGDGSQRPLDGQITVNHHLNGFPSTQWPVYQSYFKALVHLTPGPNRLRLDFSSPKVSSSNGSIPNHSSFLHINYLPLNSAPPLQLAIILGSDSEGTYDATPDRIEREGNGLDLAVKKFRMAAYLWQAFTGEQMQRNGFLRRCFRFEEEWQPGTLSYQDWATGEMRNEAKVHIIRSKMTVAEIRSLEMAQQNHQASDANELHNLAREAVNDYFHPAPGEKQHVSCLFLDSHWDPRQNIILGHAALGGGNLAIFGSHCLQSYPSSIEEVWQAFTDCTRTDTAYVANDCGDAGSNWESANIGIGAHLHETGHLFGCPHQESGVMLRDYVTLNRTFICQEPYSTRTKSSGMGLVLQHDECNWHRLDTLRFRIHPCFRIPTDLPVNGDGSVQVWNVDKAQGGVIATAATGIAWIELKTDDDDICHHWKEFTEGSGNGPYYPRQFTLSEAELRDLLPKEKRQARLKLEIFSLGGGKHVVEDMSQLAANKNARVKLPDGRWGYRGSKLGYSQMEGSEPHQVIFDYVHIQTKLLLTIRVWSGLAVDGLEFIYEDTDTQLFGKRGGHYTDFNLDTRRGELLMGFALRAGLWIDGLQILTSLGRKSEWFGNATGGSGHTLIPPRGYTIGGISGSCGQWLDGFEMIITR